MEPYGAPASTRLDHLARQRPDLVLAGPYLLYLALLATRDLGGSQWVWLFTILRGALPLLLVWRLRAYLPPLGSPHVWLALFCGVLAAAGWAAGQHLLNQLGVPQRLPLPLFPGRPETTDPRDLFGAGGLMIATVALRIAVAGTTVAIVEELFWRGYLLRAFIRWHDFERIPLGTFSWRAMIATALLSMLQHPDNWVVSIVCWLFFNALMFWKRSLLFIMLVHGFTNLALYLYMVTWKDWLFW